MRVLVTGAAGFVGHHVAKHFEDQGHEVVALVRMNKIGDLNRLRDVGFGGQTIWHDLASPITGTVESRLGDFDVVLHMAGETHVDRSITDPASFALANVVGTTNLLMWAVKHAGRYIQFSTDEVFGPALYGVYHGEHDVHHPNNPYAASKAGAEDMVMAFKNTYKLNASIVRSMNIFGPRQHKEKFIPMCVRYVLEGKTIPIHSDPSRTLAGSRFYIHASDVARGLEFVLKLPEDGLYHLVGEREVDNQELAELVGSFLGMPVSTELVDFHSSRPGHDLRYALEDNHLKAAGWELPKDTFEMMLERTVEWYALHQEWL